MCSSDLQEPTFFCTNSPRGLQTSIESMALSAGQQHLLGGVVATLQALDHAFLGIGDVVQAIEESFTEAKTDLKEFTRFDLAPKFKTRVINVPKAVDQFWLTFDDLKRIFVNGVTDIENLVKDLEQTLKAGGSLHEPGEPGLAAAVNTLQDVHAFMLRLADAIRTVISLSAALRRIKHELESLDALFLQQGNPKSTVDDHYRKRIKRNG